MRDLTPLRYLLPGSLLVLVMACGGNDPPLAPPTSAPIPTPTREPSSSDISAAGFELLGLGESVDDDFPVELQSESPSLPDSEVVELWTEWMSDTVTVIGDEQATQFCGDGTGTQLFNSILPEAGGESFRWHVESNSATPWNIVTLVMEYNNPTLVVSADPNSSNVFRIDIHPTSDTGVRYSEYPGIGNAYKSLRCGT